MMQLGQTCTPGVDPGCYGPVQPDRQFIVSGAGEAYDWVKEHPILAASIGGLTLLLLLMRRR